MDLVESKTIVGGAIADLLAYKTTEGKLRQAPAGKIIDHGHRPTLGVVRRRPRIAVLEQVDEHRRATVVAIDPDTQSLVGAPVLRHPGIARRIGEAANETGKNRHVQIRSA